MADPSIRDLAYRGLAATLGGPVDIATMFMRPFGYKTPDQQVLGGSEWIGQKMQDMGIVSSARSPLQEFVASMIVPSPDDLVRAASMAPALIGSIKGIDKIGDALKGKSNNLLESAPQPMVNSKLPPIREVKSNNLMQAASRPVVNSKLLPIRKGEERFFHAGSDRTDGGVFDKVPAGGLFDGFFALKEYGNYGTGAKYFADVKKEKILTDYDLNYELPYEKVAGKLEAITGIKRTDNRFDDLWESVVEDKSHKVLNRLEDSEISDLFKYDNIGEASWEAQRLRGLLAKKLGYDVVEMSDENGTSYLITQGTKLYRDTD